MLVSYEQGAKGNKGVSYYDVTLWSYSVSMLYVLGGGSPSSLYRHPVRESRIWVYREPCIPDIPEGAISGIPVIPGIPYTATQRTAHDVIQGCVGLYPVVNYVIRSYLQ
jgi:hypothetical protein